MFYVSGFKLRMLSITLKVCIFHFQRLIPESGIIWQYKDKRIYWVYKSEVDYLKNSHGFRKEEYILIFLFIRDILYRFIYWRLETSFKLLVFSRNFRCFG